MLRGSVGLRYAAALFEIASKEEIIDELEQDLGSVEALLNENRELLKVLYHPRITQEEKKDLLTSLFWGKVSVTTLEFLKLLVDRRREQYLPDITRQYTRLANESRNISEARIASAVELSGEERQQLADVLNRITGKKIKTFYSVDPSLIGGVVVRIGDRVIDGSVRSRLVALRERLRQIS